MSKLAIVVQRYGAEVNGGAELHARLLAQALKPYYEVEVLTSRALNHHQWDHHFPADPAEPTWMDGVRVLRFDHPMADRSRRRHLPLRHKLRFLLRKPLQRLGLKPVAQPSGAATDGLRFLRAQGPTMDGLMTHLAQHGGDYAALIFITARFHPSALGVMVRPERSILVPTLHDEKAMYLPQFHATFRAPRWIMFNTASEQALAQHLYGADIAPGEVCGVGVPLPEPGAQQRPEAQARWAEVQQRFGLKGPYLLYLGRVDASKGCDALFQQFADFSPRMAQPLQLVVAGQLFMSRPGHPGIVCTGFVDEALRDDLVAHALALVIPSRHESLSLVLLEAMAHGCPVIANAHSDVLKQHVIDSGSGHTYADAAELEATVARVLAHSTDERAANAERGRQYVEQRYGWPAVVAKFQRAISLIERQGQPPHPAPR